MTLTDLTVEIKSSLRYAMFNDWGVWAHLYTPTPKSSYWNVMVYNKLGITEPSKRHPISTGLTLADARRKVSSLNAMERELQKFRNEAADLERAIINVPLSHRGYALHLTHQLATLRKRARRVPSWVGQRMNAAPRQYPKVVYVVMGENGEQL